MVNGRQNRSSKERAKPINVQERKRGEEMPRALLGLIILIWLCPSPALAGLGDSKSNINKDFTELKGFNMVTNTWASGEVIGFSIPGGEIREYVDSNGQIVAVAWNGLSHPDLSVLLGSYFQNILTLEKRIPAPRLSRQRKRSRLTWWLISTVGLASCTDALTCPDNCREEQSWVTFDETRMGKSECTKYLDSLRRHDSHSYFLSKP